MVQPTRMMVFALLLRSSVSRPSMASAAFTSSRPSPVAFASSGSPLWPRPRRLVGFAAEGRRRLRRRSDVTHGAMPSTSGGAVVPSNGRERSAPDDAPYFRVYYNDVYEVDMPPGHRFPMGKYRKVREAFQNKVRCLSEEEQTRVNCEFSPSPLATNEQLVTTHDARYVHRYLSGDMTEKENRNIGFPWSHQHVNRTLSSVGGTVAAACSAWEEYRRRHSYSLDKTSLCWGAHIAGGTHHAFRDYGEGFCIFSDIAVAANVLLQKYGSSSSTTQQYPTIERILIIDLDVHQGNGNAALFDGNHRVQTFSMHCAANYFSKIEHSDLDVELPIGSSDETYLSTLRYWLGRIENHKFGDDDKQNKEKRTPHERKQFDLIFFQSGVDIHEQDRLGRLSVTADGISKRNALVFDFAHRMASPLVICMGGGYPRGDDWTPIIEAHTGVYWEAHQYLSNKCRMH